MGYQEDDSDLTGNTAAGERAESEAKAAAKAAEQQRRLTLVAGLRAAADFYERATDVRVPNEYVISNYVVNTKEDARAIIKALGSCEKSYDEYYFTITKQIVPGFQLRFVLTRDNVCEKVQVGTKIVPEHVQPAQEAIPEKVVPARIEPMYEYHCASILAEDGVGKAASDGDHA